MRACRACTAAGCEVELIAADFRVSREREHCAPFVFVSSTAFCSLLRKAGEGRGGGALDAPGCVRLPPILSFPRFAEEGTYTQRHLSFGSTDLIRLVGIDVDGTLVGSSGMVNPAIWAAAAAARAAGIHLVLCSGRPAFGLALDYARRLDPDGWHVFQNGASVMSLARDESRSVTLDPATLADLIEQARQSGDVLELYGDTTYVTESDSVLARDHAVLLGVELCVRPFESLGGKVVRAQWVVPLSQSDRIMQSPHAGVEIALSTSPLMPDTAFIGMTRAGTNKGTAMLAIAREYGISPGEVMYVGDADNDLPALGVVGHPVAMANASPRALAAASFVTGHVEEGGLAQALTRALPR